jgi:lipopolysaccharide transport system permease protein
VQDAGYVITAKSRPGGPGALWRHRGLVASLALKEVQVRYRQALLGVAWALLQPVALMIVTTLVFHRMLAVSTGTVPYPLFVFAGLVPWTTFHTAVTGAVPSLVSNADLVRKIWFPREALPLGHVAAVFLDLAVGVLLLLVLAVSYGFLPTLAWLAVPPLLLVLVVTTAAFALFFSAVNVYFRDVKHALPLLLQVVFFATPIVYPLTAVPDRWRGAFALNPLTAVVEGARAALLEGHAPDARLTSIGSAVAVGLLVVSWVVFRRAERRFADVV